MQDLKEIWEYIPQLKNWHEKIETELGPVSDSYSGSARTSSLNRWDLMHSNIAVTSFTGFFKGTNSNAWTL